MLSSVDIPGRLVLLLLLFWGLVGCFFETEFLCVALEPVLELALVNQAGLELRDPPASASSVLGLKEYATTAQL